MQESHLLTGQQCTMVEAAAEAALQSVLNSAEDKETSLSPQGRPTFAC